jgi:hypothetical protein
MRLRPYTVRDLWLEYKSQAVPPDFHITKRQRFIKSKFDRHRRAHPVVSPSPTSSPASAPDDWDEYERWLLNSPDPFLEQQNDNDNQSDIVIEIDPIEYWWGQRMAFPTLSKMSLDVLTAMPMSADCERLFSAAGLMVVPLRNRLEASTIRIT